MHCALPREHAAPAVDKRATQRSRIEPRSHLIGKSGENAALDRSRFYFAGLQIESFIARDRQELIVELSSFAGRAGIDPETRATP